MLTPKTRKINARIRNRIIGQKMSNSQLVAMTPTILRIIKTSQITPTILIFIPL